MLRLAWYTADSIRRFDSKTNRTADSIRDLIRTKKTIRRSLLCTLQQDVVSVTISFANNVLYGCEMAVLPEKNGIYVKYKSTVAEKKNN